MMGELMPFFIVLFAAVFFSELFFRFHFPWVVALIIGGILIGPSAFNVFQPNEIITFLSEIGLVFLMFMAGLESHMFGKRHIKSVLPFFKIAFLSSVIPFIVGVVVALLFGLSTLTAIFLGVTFISSSVAAIVPTLDARGLLRCRMGRTIISSVIVSDILSLIALSVVLQIANPVTKLPLLLFYPLLFLLLLSLRWFIPKIFAFSRNESKASGNVYHQDLRIIFLILVGTALSFQVLGLHPVVAGFFAGVVLSGSIRSKILYESIRAVSYGIFIPIFFILVGVQVDVTSLFTSKTALALSGALTLGAILAKLFSGYIGGIAAGFQKQESRLIGAATIPQLSTTLAVAFTGLEAGLLSQEVVSALIVVSLVTTTFGSYLIGKFSKNFIRDEVEVDTKESETIIQS